MAKDLSPSTHPLTPPLTEEEWLDWLRLLRSRRVGISTFFRLLKEFGNAAQAIEALPSIAVKAGVNDYKPASVSDVMREWQNAKRAGAQAVAIGSEAYPTQLAAIPDPPPILWALGNLDLVQKPCIAIVGARNASSLGSRMARKLATDLGAAGHVVVSGMARGIDTAAHLAAMQTGTVAVFAGGVDIVYPAENAVLAQEIQENGLRLSEMPVHTTPTARHFPRRNRLVSGLVQAVVVVEAASKSGSLITAKTALDQGREVMAIPGHPFDARSGGTNILLRDGATLVRSAKDVIEALETPTSKEDAPENEPIRPVHPKDIAELHRKILDRLGATPVPEDQVIRDINVEAEIVSPEIATLEIEGLLRRDSGGLLSRTS